MSKRRKISEDWRLLNPTLDEINEENRKADDKKADDKKADDKKAEDKKGKKEERRKRSNSEGSDLENEKIENFDEKCHMYNLGELDLEADNVILGNKTKKENKEMTEVFNKIKLHLYDKTVTIDNILSLKHINELEKVKLVEKYCIMKNNETNLEDYIKYRDILKEEVTKIQCMTEEDIKQKVKMDTEIKKLESLNK